jgi:hypothetical protein
LWCFENQLTALDVSKNSALTHLYCWNNQLTALDVSKNNRLEQLWCHNNQLAKLDVSGATALATMSCTGNLLTYLNVSNNPSLAYLSCANNLLSANALDALFSTLNDNIITGSIITANNRGKTIFIARNPGADSCNKYTAVDKGWNVNLEFNENYTIIPLDLN